MPKRSLPLATGLYSSRIQLHVAELSRDFYNISTNFTICEVSEENSVLKTTYHAFP